MEWRGRANRLTEDEEEEKSPTTTDQLTSCEFWDEDERARGFCAPFCVGATVVLRRS